MEFNQKKRSELEKKYTWNLEGIFPNHDALDQALEKVTTEIQQISKWEGHIMDSADTLLRFFQETDQLIIEARKIGVYISNRFNENNGDPTYQTYYAKLQAMFTELSSSLSFVNPELLQHEKSDFQRFIEEKPELQIFEKRLNDILKYKPHTLSAEEEKIISTLSPLFDTGSRAFSMLTVADMKFPDVEVEGKLVPLTHGNFVPLMEKAPRKDRKSIFETFYQAFDQHKNTLATTLDATVKSNAIQAKLKNFSSARHQALFQNAIPLDVYDSLIETVHHYLPELHDYMDVRKKVLGLEDLHLFDIYAPLVEDVDMTFSFEEARDMILDAMKPLGNDYVNVLRHGFDNRWCDVFETEGKRTGAYSSGSYGTDPFILLNYHGTLDNVFTVAHEMGHSMHTYHSNKYQPYCYSRYSIFVAEVASTLNESLLTYYLLDQWKDEKRRKYVLNHFLETIRGTLFRQTQFAEFERDIYAQYEKGGALTADFLSEQYHQLNGQYYGPTMTNDDSIRFEWARIPHFYYNFYVYQYATGISCALSFAKRILEGGEKERELYLGYLKSGSSLDPIDVLKRAGVDISTPQPVEDAIELFKKFKEEFKSYM
ncbi:MAG: oligoendopeptidase F [Tissierellia bacterium]|nr:oligoendopeptidase F [Tissierellia bacterium]